MWAGKIYQPSWWLSRIFSEWTTSQSFVTGPPSMAGLTSQDRPSLEKSSGASPSSVWAGWQSTYAAGDKSPATKHNTYVLFCSTVKQFTTRTVSTSLTSSTEPIRDATFPKIVICNKYRLRWRHFLKQSQKQSQKHRLYQESYCIDTISLKGNRLWTFWCPVSRTTLALTTPTRIFELPFTTIT